MKYITQYQIFLAIIIGLIALVAFQHDSVEAKPKLMNTDYKSHEYPVLQIEKGVDSPNTQVAGDEFAKAYLNLLKTEYPDLNTELTDLYARKYKLHEVWHVWLHVKNGHIIFNYGKEKK